MRFSRLISAASRSVLASPSTLKVSRMSSATPASDKHLDLAELLAGDADRAGLHLHPGEAGILWVLMCGRLASP